MLGAVTVVPLPGAHAAKWEPAAAVGLMTKCNKTVTFFDCQFERKFKNVLTASAITTKRPEPIH
jgi:hypothetical protein